MANEDNFLVSVYTAAASKHVHHDQLLGRLSSFFLAFAAVAAAALTILFETTEPGGLNDGFRMNKEVFAGSVLLIVGSIGVSVVGVLAHQRRNQITQTLIMLEVMDHFLPANPHLKSLVSMYMGTRPKEIFTSGKFYWASGIILVSSVFVGMGVWLVWPHRPDWLPGWLAHETLLGILSAFSVLCFLIVAYYKMSLTENAQNTSTSSSTD